MIYLSENMSASCRTEKKKLNRSILFGLVLIPIGVMLVTLAILYDWFIFAFSIGYPVNPVTDPLGLTKIGGFAITVAIIAPLLIGIAWIVIQARDYKECRVKAKSASFSP